FLNSRTYLLDREMCDAILVIELQHLRPTLLKLRGDRISQFLRSPENDWLRLLPERKEVDLLMVRRSAELEIDLTTDLFEVSGKFKSEPTRGRQQKRQGRVHTVKCAFSYTHVDITPAIFIDQGSTRVVLPC